MSNNQRSKDVSVLEIFRGDVYHPWWFGRWQTLPLLQLFVTFTQTPKSTFQVGPSCTARRALFSGRAFTHTGRALVLAGPSRHINRRALVLTVSGQVWRDYDSLITLQIISIFIWIKFLVLHKISSLPSPFTMIPEIHVGLDNIIT